MNPAFERLLREALADYLAGRIDRLALTTAYCRMLVEPEPLSLCMAGGRLPLLMPGDTLRFTRLPLFGYRAGDMARRGRR